MNVGIVAQRGNENATDLAGALCEMLDEEDVSIWVDEATSEHVDARGVDVDRMTECNLVVSIGGDGTFLFAARGAGGTPILGVNLGEVGFLNAVAPEDAVEEVRETVTTYRERGAVPSREAPRLTASGDGDWSTHPALNEIVVLGAQRGHGQGAEFEVEVDGTTYDRGHADGVLVSTPTGSSAYNLSEGGRSSTPTQTVWCSPRCAPTTPCRRWSSTPTAISASACRTRPTPSSAATAPARRSRLPRPSRSL